MVAKLTGGVSKAGVVAYQDDQDAKQFHYWPANIDCVIGETLRDFSVTPWGIGNEFIEQENLRSIVGGILAGRAALDISEYQRAQIRSEIARVYEFADVKLLPMQLTDVQVQPVVGANTLKLGPGGDVNFPKTLQLGQSFVYLVGTGESSLFAQFVGAASVGDKIVSNPSFGINVTGSAEFLGDPWRVKVTADLSQVWKYTRKQFSAGINFGWWRISLGDYEQTIIDLAKNSVIKLDFFEGTLDNEKYGRQILEMGRDIYEAINAQAGAGVGFFRFEPNPDPQSSDNPTSGGAWPFLPSINLGYGERSLEKNQHMHLEREISYHGRVRRTLPVAMTLAVSCNDASKQYFHDLGSPKVPCITQDKVDLMQQRLQDERTEKKKKAEQLYDKFIMGEISEERYLRAMDLLYNSLTFREDLMPVIHTRGGRGFTRGLTEDQIWAKLLGESPTRA